MKTIIKRGRPDVTGQPCAVTTIPVGLRFGGGRDSPYDRPLLSLLTLPKTECLVFADGRAKTAVYSRSKKLGLRVEFAAGEDGKLYCRVLGWLLNSERGKLELRAAILDVIDQNPRMPIQICNELRALGRFTDLDAGIVEAVLKQLEQEAKAKRKSDGSWEPK